MNAKSNTLIKEDLIASGHLIARNVLLIETEAGQAANNIQACLSSQYIQLQDTLNVVEDLCQKVNEYKPNVLVLSVDFLDAAMLSELIDVNHSCPLPVVVFAKQHAPEILKTVVSAGVDSYVVDDVQEHRLSVIIELAVMRSENLNDLNTQLHQVKEKLTERKIIERAKGILMQQKKFTEQEAYVQMRNSAMNKGQSMVELGQNIIEVFEMLD